MPPHVHFTPVPYPRERRFGLRLPGRLYERLMTLATRDDRSLNEEVVHLLRLAAAIEEALARVNDPDEPSAPSS